MLRAMHWTDIPAVVELEQALFPVDAWTAEMFWAELAGVPESRDVSVVVVDEKVVGYCSARFVGRDGDVNTIAVANQSQGHGYGRLMLTHMHEVFRSKRVEQVFLEVRSDNSAALSLYEKFGYEKIDVRKNYYGGEIDALVLRCKLGGSNV